MENTQKQAKIRNSNIEILRLIAMLMIFFHHAILHGGTSFFGTMDLQDYIRESLYHLGKLGVVIYLLISGYCLTNAKFSWNKLIKLVIEVILFSMSLYFFDLIYSKKTFVMNDFINTLLPFSSYQYWFMSAYLLLYLLSPFLNAGLDKIGQKNHIIFIVVSFLLSSFIPSLLGYTSYTGSIIVFVETYLIGAYLKRYPLKDLKYWKYIILGLSIILFLFFNYLIVRYTKDTEIKNELNNWFYNNNSPLCILIGLGIFIFFIQLKPRYNKVMNFVAMSTLEIYLFHDSNYMRPHIFKFIHASSSIPHSSTWALEFIGETLLRFIFVLLITLVIKYIYNLVYSKLSSFTKNIID